MTRPMTRHAKMPTDTPSARPTRNPTFAEALAFACGPDDDIDDPDDEPAPQPAPTPTHPHAPITETFLPDEPDYIASRRQDGWSAANQRAFLEAIAEGHGVEAASRRVGLSATSAYAFRRTAKGATFALGWRAAGLVARDAIAETLLVRALEGTVDTVVRGEIVTTRHKYDNRLALALLARLDRQVESAPDADVKAARLVAQEFDAYLDLVARDEGAARAGLFLARRAGDLGEECDLAPIYALAAADRFARTGIATAAEVDVADLDPHGRAGWTAEQWQRAEAAGMIALAPEPVDPDPAETARSSQHSQHSCADDPDPVWWNGEVRAWRTSFPPPEEFYGLEQGEFGDAEYERELDDDELAFVLRADAIDRTGREAVRRAARDRWFAALAVDDAGAPQPNDAPDDAPAPESDAAAAERPSPPPRS